MRKLSVPEWCCAIRFNDSENVSLMDDNKSEFAIIKDSYRYWSADPFLYKRDEKYYLFFEMFDRLKRKGLLGCREVSKNGIGKMQIVYECDGHLSYPFIYEEDGEIYMLPESSSLGQLFRLRCVEFPLKWEKDSVLIHGHFADTTPVFWGATKYYISEKIVKKGVFDRVDILYEQDGRVYECTNNPVKLDVNTARCAGKIFEHNNELIRPSQDCGQFYGEKLNFNKIVEISKENYKEETVKTVLVKDIKLNQKNDFIGIHTYNKLGNVEVIDLKIGANFNILNIIGGVLKRLRR